MKSKSPLITVACIAAVALCAPSTVPAKGKKSPTPEASASASPAASTATMAKPRAIAFHGKVTAIEATAKTFTIGKRTIKVTDQTTITKQGAAATIADIVVEDKVSGSYWKKADGTLEAKSVKIGVKTTEETPTTDAQKKEESATTAASPSSSP